MLTLRCALSGADVAIMRLPGAADRQDAETVQQPPHHPEMGHPPQLLHAQRQVRMHLCCLLVLVMRTALLFMEATPTLMLTLLLLFMPILLFHALLTLLLLPFLSSSVDASARLFWMGWN